MAAATARPSAGQSRISLGRQRFIFLGWQNRPAGHLGHWKKIRPVASFCRNFPKISYFSNERRHGVASLGISQASVARPTASFREKIKRTKCKRRLARSLTRCQCCKFAWQLLLQLLLAPWQRRGANDRRGVPDRSMWPRMVLATPPSVVAWRGWIDRVGFALHIWRVSCIFTQLQPLQKLHLHFLALFKARSSSCVRFGLKIIVRFATGWCQHGLNQLGQFALHSRVFWETTHILTCLRLLNCADGWRDNVSDLANSKFGTWHEICRSQFGRSRRFHSYIPTTA